MRGGGGGRGGLQGHLPHLLGVVAQSGIVQGGGELRSVHLLRLGARCQDPGRQQVRHHLAQSTHRHSQLGRAGGGGGAGDKTRTDQLTRLLLLLTIVKLATNILNL